MVFICFRPRKVSKSARRFFAAAFHAPWRSGIFFSFLKIRAADVCWTSLVIWPGNSATKGELTHWSCNPACVPLADVLGSDQNWQFLYQPQAFLRFESRSFSCQPRVLHQTKLSVGKQHLCRRQNRSVNGISSPFRKHFCGVVYKTVGNTESDGRCSPVTQHSMCGFTLLQAVGLQETQTCSSIGEYLHNRNELWLPTVVCAAFGQPGLDAGGTYPGEGPDWRVAQGGVVFYGVI